MNRNRADIIEDAEFLADMREHPANAARRLGYRNAVSLETVLIKWGRSDLAARFRANDGLGMVGTREARKY